MSRFPDLASLVEALEENSERPNGVAKAAAAEELLAHAEDMGQTEALVQALIHLVAAYEFSSDQDRQLVPFARLLRLWDTSPEAFDSYDAASLHWYFKWASSGMLKTPDVSLAAIESWHGEMGRRYAVAGYSPRAVRQAGHAIAAHLGDAERARAALAEWWAVPRDAMSDCVACEIGERGAWFAGQGEDAAALDAWADVLGGEETCTEEPHRVLALALLPLLRLGRLDEACAAHLRGYALTRGAESLAGAVARHIEFCALTGNEGRALELLAEQPGYLTSDGNLYERTEFRAVTALLMDRLVALGLAELVVPGPPGQAWTAADLAAWAHAGALADAARFDARNGNDTVSTRVRRRMDAAPLLARLPLGTRSMLPSPAASAPAAASAAPAPAPSASGAPAAAADQAGPSDAASSVEASVAASSVDGAAVAASGTQWPDPAVDAAEERFRLAAEAGDHGAARAALLEATELAGGAAPSGWRAWVAVQLGEASAALGDLDAAVRYAREGTYWHDLDPNSFVPRYRLGAHLMAAGRLDEAGPTLEHVLADLDATPDAPEGPIVQTRWWLGEVYADHGDDLAAAAHWAAAAEIAQTWDDQDDHAVLSYLIGGALRRAGRGEEATAAYQRAAGLFGDLGQPVRRCIAQRALAWLRYDDDPRSASVLMRFAIMALEAAKAEAAAQADSPADDEVGYELAESWRQHALVLVEYDDDGDWTPHFDGALSEAYASALRAAELFTGPEEWRVDRLGCVLLAGELAHALGDDTAARPHLTEVLADRTDSDRAAQFRDVAASVLERLTA